jgi:hypothetical protein
VEKSGGAGVSGGVCGARVSEFSESEGDRARAHEEPLEREPRYAPLPWVSKQSREDRSILDYEF